MVKRKVEKKKGRSRGRGRGGNRRMGYKYEAEILKSLELLRSKYILNKRKNLSKLWYYKMVDTYAYDWIKELGDLPEDMIKTGWQHRQELILPKVPADIDCVFDGQAFKIECKSTKNKLGFNPFDPYVKDHQLRTAIELEAAGIVHYFFICDRSVPRHHRTFVVRGFQLERIRERLIKKDRKRILWKDLKDYADYILPKQKYQVFDLSFLVDDKKALEVIYDKKRRKHKEDNKGGKAKS